MTSTTLERELVYQCAPLCMDIKIGNTLIIDIEFLDKLKELLPGKRIQYIDLGNRKDKVVLLLYDKEKLDLYLHSEGVEAFLLSCGYQEQESEDRLVHLRERYQVYQRTNVKFPHEIGVFLGYPLDDIIGFINNEGKNYLFSGYWKVYNKEFNQRKLFRYYKEAKRLLLFCLKEGISLKEIL